jgi:ribosome biogenesis GTPase
MNKKIGRIIKGIGGFYSVDCDGQVFACKARGKFRKQDIRPTVGDIVEFSPPHDISEGYLDRILDRKNIMLRPSVANIDLIIIVVAVKNPLPDFMLVDKMLINASMMGTDALICINKYDLTGLDEAKKLKEQYQNIDTVIVSAKEHLGLEALKEYFNGKIVCLGGQSGTGKTSLLNAIIPEKRMETGGLSKKTKRGRHTTRHAELLPFNGGYLVDTPGFSLLDLPLMEPNELSKYYTDFQKYEGECKFNTCRHDCEPGCCVIDAVNNGNISKERHERYRIILKENEEKWRTRYD